MTWLVCRWPGLFEEKLAEQLELRVGDKLLDPGRKGWQALYVAAGDDNVRAASGDAPVVPAEVIGAVAQDTVEVRVQGVLQAVGKHTLQPHRPLTRKHTLHPHWPLTRKHTPY